ncbi:MAG: Trk family potassium uptake protein [Clostridia bacterium]|nr:Trk family potassium uptake protein [Clostridia bacterium]
MKNKKRARISYPRLLAGGFGILILIGALLLTLPIASKSGQWSDPVNCLFTATSATCVTGLIAYDTFTHWSMFGQLVILFLIQIGGLGFMTIISIFAMLAKKRISLRDRLLLMQSSGSMDLDGVGRLIQRIIVGTLFFEMAGAVLLSIRFIPMYGWGEGIYNAIFHSVSAFCNAGFDLMGKEGAFSSLTTFNSDPLVLITVILLIVIGGIGFLVWSDISHYKCKLKRYSLHSKIALTTTVVLLIGGTLFYYFAERGGNLAAFSEGDKWLNAAFQSVTLRTAGFNAVDQSALSPAGSILGCILMLIGGSPGSTAGGVKTVTIAVVLIAAFALSRNRRETEVFKRRLPDGAIRQAFAVLIIYIIVLFTSVILLSFTESFDLREIFFEVSSAIGTVGITMGITQSLSLFGKLLITFVMFFGRIGGLSMVMAFSEDRPKPHMQRPEENILIG